MRFRNLDGSQVDKTVGDLLRWKLGLRGREPTALPASHAPAPQVPNDGAALRGAPHPAVTWIGHASWLVQLGGASLLIDPVLSTRLTLLPRLVPPGLAFEALPAIDAILVTHNHRDHMDGPTLERLPREARVIVPSGLGGWFARRGFRDVVELGWFEACDVRDARVTFVPAQHWSMRSPFDRNESLWGGFVVEDGTHRVYHSGDTAYFDGFATIRARLGRIDAALLPIGAYEPRWFMRGQHMNPADAVQAFRDLGATRFFAMHWGTFKLTDEPVGEPPLAVAAHWRELDLEPERLAVPAVGETLRLDRAPGARLPSG